MKTALRIFTLFALFALPVVLSSSAQAEKTEKFNEDIKLVETYLNQLTSARARFVQTTHDGTQLVGTFFLDRPGKLRFEYDDPIKDFVVADGVFIYFYDAELGEQTNAPIGQTLADFILRKDIKLSDDVIVESIRRKGGLLQVQIVQASDPTAGSLTLGFEEEPFKLNKWRVVVGQGLITEVELFYLKTGIKHPNGLFTFQKPGDGNPNYNE